MPNPVRVMIEQGKKKTVASAFDWPGWDRAAKSEEEALSVLATYRSRYASVAELAGLANEFRSTGALEVVERLDGTGMTDFYGVSAKSARPERQQMSDDECKRKISLLRACWPTSMTFRHSSQPSFGRGLAEEVAIGTRSYVT